MSLIKEKENNPTIGTIYVLLSAICFSTGGILIKLIPWSPITINGLRSIFAMLVMLIYMKLIGHSMHFNRNIIFCGLCTFLMTLTFVISTKMTTAANTIILQFTNPIFLILILWIFFHKKPDKKSIITCFFVMVGIIFFFLDQLSPGQMTGNLLAIFSGLTYAIVFLMKQIKDSDFESSLVICYFTSFIVGLPSTFSETQHTLQIWIFIILLGVVQVGFSYVFLSRGLDTVSPITASLTSGIEPILNPTLVAIFYGEMIGRQSLIGGIIVFITIIIYSILQIKDQQVAQA